MSAPCTIHRPPQPSPLVLDSPHSGRDYPDDFSHICTENALKASEDRFVDVLLYTMPDIGISTLLANFPRTYIDVNRALDEIDPEILSEPWPHAIKSSKKTSMGAGLIRRYIKQGMPVYDGPLTVAEVEHRIENYYKPYYQALDSLITETHNQFGKVWHIDVHSMPYQTAPVMMNGLYLHPTMARADFVIGDRDGTSADRSFTKFVKKALERKGYKVAINNPYKGVEIVKRYGQPHTNQHSIQLEINKALYLNDKSWELNDNYPKLKADLESVMDEIRAWCETQIVPLAAD